MKSAKKLLLLVLSLVLLIGIFAVVALAEDAPEAATVVYPDGTVDTYTAVGAITPSIAVENGLYYGKGNTLYKDNAGNGWTYTDESGNAVTEITDELLAAGAKITASGLDQVYSKIDIHFPNIEYYKWIQGQSNLGKIGDTNYYDTVFAPAGCTDKVISYPSAIVDGAVVYSEITVSTTKRSAGDFTVYFYDEESLQNFFSTSAAVEVDGVVLDYQDLRAGSGTKHTVTLYTDHILGNMFQWSLDHGFDRANTDDGTGKNAQSGGNASVYFDFNGHSLTNTSTSYYHAREIRLYLYSSKPGAHLFKELSAEAFYVNNNTTLYLGSNQQSTNADIKDNLHVHVRGLFKNLDSGQGVYIYGGHYYQTDATASALIPLTNRLYAVQNASFYVKDGINVFHNVPTTTVVNCNFYTNGTSAILGGTSKKELKLQDCNFYGVSTTADATTVGTVNLVSGNNFYDAVTYSTVTWVDETTNYYLAASLDEAKAYVESFPNAKVIAPLAILEDDGKTMYYVANPVSIITYDDAFSAVQTADGEKAKVYFTSTEVVGNITTVVYHTTNDLAAYFTSNNLGDTGDRAHVGANPYSALATTNTQSITIVLYSDFDISTMYWALSNNSNGGNNVPTYFDLNGYNMVVGTNAGGSHGNGMDGIKLYVYSSKPGAHYYSAGSVLFAPDDRTSVLLGDNGSGNYCDNISFHCKKIYGTIYGSGSAVIGGHYYQLEGATEPLLPFARRLTQVKNASFYAQNGLAILTDTPYEGSNVSNGSAKITNCKFYSFGTSPLLTLSNSASKPAFTGCSFYNITINYDALADVTSSSVTPKTVTWVDGTREQFFAESLDEVKAYVEGLPKAKHVAPYASSGDDGKTMYYVASPVSILAYDDALNVTQTADGERATVYYTVYRSGYDLYYGLKDNVHTILTLGNFSGSGYDATVTLYADVDVSSFSFGANSSGIGLNFNMNGHTIRVENKINITYVSARIYSTRPGAHFYCTGSTGTLFDNNSVLYLGATYGGDYAGNVTFHAKCILGGSTAQTYVRGGSFYQTGISAIGGFFSLNGAVSEFKNSNLYVLENQPVFVHSATSLVSQTIANGNVGIINCNIYASGSAHLLNATTACTPVFDGCRFINVAPAKTMGAATLTFLPGCYFNLPCDENICQTDTPAYTVRINPIAFEGLVAEDGTPISASLIYQGMDATNTLKISAENMVTTYWAIGTTFVAEPGNFETIIGNKLYYNPYYDVSGVSQIVDGEIKEAGEVTLAIEFRDSDDLAFVYTVGGFDIPVCYNLDCGGTAEGIFEKFYELFNDPASAYVITMYMDMTVTKAVPFGPLVKYYTNTETDKYNRDYYNSFVKGSIVWDLNGTTVTIASNVSGLIKLDAANVSLNVNNPGSETWTGNTVFGFEGSSVNNTFTLKSSKADGRIVNESSAHLFGTGEGRYSKIFFEGENLTIVSPKGLILNSRELSRDYKATDILFSVDGGTYICGHSTAVFAISRGASIKNATLISTNASVANVIKLDGYRTGAVAFENVIFSSANAAAPAFKPVDSTNKYSATVADCVFINCIPPTTAISEQFSSVAYTGTNLVSSEENLALAYEGIDITNLVKAYLYKMVDGADYKLMGYYADGFAPIDWGFGMKENWVIGSKATHENAIVDNVFGYTFADIEKVVSGEQKATATLAGILPGTLKMSLTLQSQIGLNLFFVEGLKSVATKITVGGTEVTLGDAENGYCAFTKAIAPTDATKPIAIVITIGENVHTVSAGVDTYAEKILASTADEHKAAYNLTYAMVEYVREITGVTEFCDVTIPDDYRQTLTAKESENTLVSLTEFAFQLGSTIAVKVRGIEAANGMEVNLVLAKGRSERVNLAKDENGDYVAVFEGLYINEFFGDMKFYVNNEEYTYNLANYLNGLTDENLKADVQALYNYAYYANDYVENVLKPASSQS